VVSKYFEFFIANIFEEKVKFPFDQEDQQIICYGAIFSLQKIKEFYLDKKKYKVEICGMMKQLLKEF